MEQWNINSEIQGAIDGVNYQREEVAKAKIKSLIITIITQQDVIKEATLKIVAARTELGKVEYSQVTPKEIVG